MFPIETREKIWRFIEKHIKIVRKGLRIYSRILYSNNVKSVGREDFNLK